MPHNWVKNWPSGLGHWQTGVAGKHVYVPLETAPNSSNRILTFCTLIEICQFMFWHLAKFQGQKLKVNFHAEQILKPFDL